MTAADMHEHISQLLVHEHDSLTLRRQLDAMARQRIFSCFTWLWGPALYERDRVLFYPFILNHFSSLEAADFESWQLKDWASEAKLEQWLQAVLQQAGEIPLAQKLLSWKCCDEEPDYPEPAICNQLLLSLFTTANTDAERERILQQFDFDFRMDEETAIALFGHSQQSMPFIMRHYRDFSQQLFDLAKSQDEDAAWAYYRETAPIDSWTQRVTHLAKTLPQAEKLIPALMQCNIIKENGRHPGHYATGLLALTRIAGETAKPYIEHSARHTAFYYHHNDHPTELLDLFADREWWTAWASLIKNCGKWVNFKISDHIIDNTSLPDQEKIRRLQVYIQANLKLELRDFATIQARWPDLLTNYSIPPIEFYDIPYSLKRSGPHEDTAFAIANNFTHYIDHYAGLALYSASTPPSEHWAGDTEVRERLLAIKNYFIQQAEESKDKELIADRLLSILAKLPRISSEFDDMRTKGTSPKALLDRNTWAKWIFTESTALLQNSQREDLLADLIESPHPCGKMLAGHLLSQPQRANLAYKQHDLILGQLWTDMPKADWRSLASIVMNAIFHADLDQTERQDLVSRMHAKLRQGMLLSDTFFPRKHAIKLLGSLLDRYPELLQKTEQMPVYGMREVAQS